MPLFVRALRGAVDLTEDTPAEISRKVERLLREAIDRNGISQEDLISVIFTATSDIRSAFPATQARKILGLGDVPLLCAKELEVEGAQQSIIRILIHFYTDLTRAEVRHVYLGAAAKLRPDFAD